MRFMFIMLLLAYYHSGALYAQGAKPIEKEQYDSLNKAMILSGGTEIDDYHVIPNSQFPPPGDQGSYFNCVGWAVGYALHSYYQGKMNFSDSLSKDHTFSFAYIYDKLKGCSNCKCEISIYEALKYLKGNGNVPLAEYPDPCRTVDTSRYREIEQKYKIKGFTPVPIENLNNIKISILNDVPVIVCIGYDADFRHWKRKTDTDIFESKREYESWWNHAVLITGYDERRRAFRVMNSWGTDWGDNGFAWISYSGFRIMSNLPRNNGYLQNPGFVIDKVFGDVTAGGAMHADTIKETSFRPYVFRETIEKNQYSFTTGFNIDAGALPMVQKITYNYDHPSFVNKISTSFKKPHFENSYTGWGCLTQMTATVFLIDGSSIPIKFNACELLRQPNTLRSVNDNATDISVITTADYISKNNYAFKIRLKGIEGLKDEIREVVYNYNHPTFKNRIQTVRDKQNNFEASYVGWGCLTNLKITILFNDGSSKLINHDMCSFLGWE